MKLHRVDHDIFIADFIDDEIRLDALFVFERLRRVSRGTIVGLLARTAQGVFCFTAEDLPAFTDSKEV